MSMTDAFLSARADDLFESVAAFADAVELETLDVAQGQGPARKAIVDAVENAVRKRANPGTRIALIKGGAGSGKTHVLTNVFRKLAADPIGQFYPVILQLTAPVQKENYDIWLLDTMFRELAARHFPDPHNQSPLQRLAQHLLEKVETKERDEFVRLIDDIEDDGEIPLARSVARKICKKEHPLLTEGAPSEPVVAVILLAGYGDWSAVNYLRTGEVDARLAPLGVSSVKTTEQRIALLKDFGLTAQIAGACLAIGFDQVENAVRLGNEELFAHTLAQATRVAEHVYNCAVVIAALADEYDRITDSTVSGCGLAAPDRDRIEHEDPRPVSLEPDTPEFLEQVITRRLAVLRQRARMSNGSGALAPLPDWLVPKVTVQRSVRLALREVAMFRRNAIKLGRLPTREEYLEGDDPAPEPPLPETDFDKDWADFLDLAPATINRLLTATKAELLVWWANEASREHVVGDLAEVSRTSIETSSETHIIDVRLKANGTVVEFRQLALCDAPNRYQKLARQVEDFLDHCTGTPAVLRTPAFAKGRTAQVAPALRRLAAMNGLKLDLSDTEWHMLQHAKDFSDQQSDTGAFLNWRRDRQWLTELMRPLQPLIAIPEGFTGQAHADAAAVPQPAQDGGSDERQAEDGSPSISTNGSQPFPVLVGRTADGQDVRWDPYREQPSHLNNFSFLVTGDAGSGKTQTIRVLIDAACRHGLSVCIFDFKADYCEPEFAEPLGLDVIDVRVTGLPFNPLQPPPRGASGVQPAEHAYELAGVLSRVFRLGAVQEGVLREAINSAYEMNGISPREWVDPETAYWPVFDQVLDPLREESRAASLVTKLSMLADLGLFPKSTSSEHSFTNFIDRRVTLKLSDLPTDEVKAALAEIIIIQLHGYALRGEQPRRLKRMMVFDEAHRVKDSVRLESLAREGRAFGVGIVIGTQFPGDIPETMAGNLATQLYLMNNQATHRRWIVRQMLGTTSGTEPRQMMEQLNALKPFEGLFSNPHHSAAMLRVIPHFERRS